MCYGESMESHDDHLNQNEFGAARGADLAKRALARHAEQLAAQKRIVESATSDWELLRARIKLGEIVAFWFSR